MTRKQRNTFLLIAAIAVIGLLWAGARKSARIADDTLGYSREFAERFAHVETGMSRASVIDLLGPPIGTGHKFRLAQRAGHEAEYKNAEASTAKDYAFWENGADASCAVGFDATDRVVVAACGRT